MKLQYQNIGQIISGKITTNPDDTSSAVFQYSGTTAGDEFEVSATYDKGNGLTGFTVAQTKQAAVVTVKEDPEKISSNEKNIAPSNLVYQAFDPKAVKDPFYGITKDFIGSQNAKYKNLNPTKTEQSDVNTIKYFRLEFTFADGSKW